VADRRRSPSRTPTVVGLVALLSAAGCGGGSDSTAQGSPPVLAPRATVLPPAAGAVATVTADELVLSVGTNDWVEHVQTGDVLVCGASCNEGRGFLRKVASVSRAGGDVTFGTTNASLADLFSSGSIRASMPLAGSTPSAGLTAASAVGPAIHVDTSADISVDADASIGLTSFQLEFDPVVDVDVAIEGFEVRSASLTASGTLAASATVGATLGTTFTATGSVDDVRIGRTRAGTVSLLTRKFGPFEFPIAAGPVVVPVVFWVEATASPGASVTYDQRLAVTETLGASGTVTAGARYAAGEWTSSATNGLAFTQAGPNVSGEANGNVRVSLPVTLTIWLYDMVGPTLGVEPYVGGSAAVACGATNPELTYEGLYGLAGTASGEVSAFGWSVSSPELNLFDVSRTFGAGTLPLDGKCCRGEPLYEGEVCVDTVTVDPSQATLEPGAITTLVARAFDPDGVEIVGEPVAWASSHPEIASVLDGVVTGVAVGGPVDVTATIGGISGHATIDVVGCPAGVRADGTLGFTVAGYDAFFLTAGPGDGLTGLDFYLYPSLPPPGPRHATVVMEVPSETQDASDLLGEYAVGSAARALKVYHHVLNGEGSCCDTFTASSGSGRITEVTVTGTTTWGRPVGSVEASFDVTFPDASTLRGCLRTELPSNVP
jgi:hypothetical protein